MIILLSPAKNLDFEPTARNLEKTAPRLDKDYSVLVKRTKQLSRSDLKSLMKISDQLADLNYVRFQALADGLPEDESKYAAFAFNGDVYRGLNAETLSDDDMLWAQSHLRILSGLYGILRPLDGIHPYRLEMGSRLSTKRGSNLYDFWDDKIAKQINHDLSEDDQFILNLASNEYFGAVKVKALNVPVLNVTFKEEKDGKSRIISFYAKYARGLMARWAIQNRVSDKEQLKTFNEDGYVFDADASNEKSFVFSRPQPSPKS